MPVLRGHGAESPEALRGVTWPDWLADAESALLDLLTEAERAVVFGHSMGGLLALNLAADHRDVVDSIALTAAAIQLMSPFGPDQPLHFLAPLFSRLFKKWDMPPTYADPALAQYDTNYAWAPTDAIASFFDLIKVTRRRLPEVQVPALIVQSRRDTTVDEVAANLIYDGISTPAGEKRIVWFEVTEHEMLRDCEGEAVIQTVVDYVKDRAGLSV
jgi:carboxylesterase